MQKPSYIPKKYIYVARTGNLKAEAVGVVKGEKHFPVFEGAVVFKPLTKSKPLSTPLFAYAEVFWSWVIGAYFMRFVKGMRRRWKSIMTMEPFRR